MKKHIAFTLLLLPLALTSFVGCGSSEPEVITGYDEMTEEQVAEEELGGEEIDEDY